MDTSYCTFVCDVGNCIICWNHNHTTQEWYIESACKNVSHRLHRYEPTQELSPKSHRLKVMHADGSRQSHADKFFTQPKREISFFNLPMASLLWVSSTLCHWWPNILLLKLGRAGEYPALPNTYNHPKKWFFFFI